MYVFPLFICLCQFHFQAQSGTLRGSRKTFLSPALKQLRSSPTVDRNKGCGCILIKRSLWTLRLNCDMLFTCHQILFFLLFFSQPFKSVKLALSWQASQNSDGRQTWPRAVGQAWWSDLLLLLSPGIKGWSVGERIQEIYETKLHRLFI